MALHMLIIMEKPQIQRAKNVHACHSSNEFTAFGNLVLILADLVLAVPIAQSTCTLLKILDVR